MKYKKAEGNFNDNQIKEIIDLYLNKNLPKSKIAKKLGCNQIVILRVLKENNIQIRPAKFYQKGNKLSTRKNLDEKEVVRLYQEELMPMNKIKDLFNCSYTPIERILREYNIPTRKPEGLKKGQTNSGSFKKGRINENKGKRSYRPVCLNCFKEIDTFNKNTKFCNHKCSSLYQWEHGIRKKEDLRWYGKRWNEGMKGYHPKNGFQMGDIRISGENNPNWKGGISPLNKKLRNSSMYKIWREAIFLRDNFTCQNPNCSYCNNKIGVYLHPHHIKSFADYPELRYNIDNGITYCKEFHINSKLLHKAIGRIKFQLAK